jgi:hypothetical protein
MGGGTHGNILLVDGISLHFLALDLVEVIIRDSAQLFCVHFPYAHRLYVEMEMYVYVYVEMEMYVYVSVAMEMYVYVYVEMEMYVYVYVEMEMYV